MTAGIIKTVRGFIALYCVCVIFEYLFLNTYVIVVRSNCVIYYSICYLSVAACRYDSNPESTEESSSEEGSKSKPASSGSESESESAGGKSPKRQQPKPEPSSDCLLYTSPSPRDRQKSRMPSSA